MFNRKQGFCLFNLLLAAVLHILSGKMDAQTAVDGAVAGTVVDRSGAVLPSAKVVVHNTATNADSIVTTGSDGYFRAERLVPGDYTVKVSAAGFSDYTAQHVVIEVGKLTEVAPKLGIAGSTATVVVSSESPVINTESSEFSTSFNPTALATLPINGRHWTSFALLSPGVTGGNSAYGLASFRGVSNLQNNFMVDGADDNDSFDGVERGYTRVGYTTPEDTVLEFQVLTSNVPAQYGRAVGGGINAVTRSGSNVFHGDAFEYYRDNDFGATNPFNTLAVPVSGAPAGTSQTIHIKPKDKRHQYGGTFSGPIKQDKLFFLYSFDQQRRNFPALATPTPQFLAAGNAANNNCKVKGGTTTTDAITCAEDRGVTASQIAAAQAYISGQTGIAPRLGDQIINFVKLDYAINSRNNASIIYDRMRWDSPNGIQTNPVVRRGITSFGNDYVKIDSVIAKITTLLSPRISNELRGNYARTYDTENGNVPLANEPTTTAGGLPPGISISPNSGFSMGTPTYIPRTGFPDEREIDSADNLTISYGKHTFTTGGEFRWAQDNIVDVDYLHGLFTYAQLADFFTDFARTQGSTAGCDAARDTGAGTFTCYSNLQQAFGRPQFVYHTNDYAVYVQDDWKLFHNFTLNLGLRYDFEQLPSPKIPNSAVPQTGQFPSDKNNIAPRVGFAYDVFGDGKTLLHGGFGLYYGRIQNGTIYKALSSTGAANAQFQLNTSSSATSPIYPNIISSATAPAVSNITAFAKGFQNPVADEFNLSIQQNIGWKTVLGVAYLGALGKQLPNFVDSNIASTNCTLSYVFSGGPLAGDVWTVPNYSKIPGTNGLCTTPATRPNSAYNALTLITSNITTAYNALAVTLDHRLSHGVQASASYTFSKALDYGMNQSATSDTNDQTDPFTVLPDYGVSSNNIPQRFVGSITFMPKFAIMNRYASLAANGWTIAPVWTVQSGVPFSYGLSNGSSLPGGATSYNGSGGNGGGSTQFVNFRAYPQFASSDVFNGVSPQRNSMKQANIDDVAARISRAFTYHEKYKLTLSGEAFNLMNRQQFTAYNTTAYTLSGTTATYQSTFGTPSAAGNTVYRERQIQFVGRFEF
ncbi:MAG: TonB-dependent receptor [Acidobacteriota bacterium]|nr:TonB-dependent receptor [Acidobacteriota bacterium]